MLVNLISYEYDWLTVRARDLEILQTYLQLQSNKDIIKIKYENLKREQLNDETNSPVFIQLYQKKPNFRRTKTVFQENQTHFKLLEKIKNKE